MQLTNWRNVINIIALSLNKANLCSTMKINYIKGKSVEEKDFTGVSNTKNSLVSDPSIFPHCPTLCSDTKSLVRCLGFAWDWWAFLIRRLQKLVSDVRKKGIKVWWRDQRKNTRAGHARCSPKIGNLSSDYRLLA